ncbi:cell cycle regulated GATA-type transcription factor Ams2 [Schizosaccharomyces japonicus yFS275]|uniref:Cell cycle regulated GATA-type transcription factor Ams2 n=1 Tax=Schizosaccharomyces japonicus (strain yFS275 / FY16936) TaxID=402676 RepID=B6K3J7_SCHJY|nr:cell cycle regulated GATA-type transcription factor Ams2 [Schizosaccharomyces japonicus yFS275]EEB08054.1 cell cycle regulated GATA-type transcription factor Ams2 [Schizosaccharomyces japonicus yFS275]
MTEEQCLPLRVIYNIGSNSSIRCLARSKTPVPVKFVAINDGQQRVCQVELRHVVQTICNSSPELRLGLQTDFSVYFMDVLEVEELFVGLGVWSELLEACTASSTIKEPTDATYVTGKIMTRCSRENLQLHMRFHEFQKPTVSKTTFSDTQVHEEDAPSSSLKDVSSVSSCSNLLTKAENTASNILAPIHRNTPGVSNAISSSIENNSNKGFATPALLVKPAKVDAKSASQTENDSKSVLVPGPPQTNNTFAQPPSILACNNAARKRRRDGPLSLESAYIASQLQNPLEREHVQDFIKQQVKLARARLDRRLPKVARGEKRVQEQLTMSVQAGKIPTYCENCGTIKTANWRNAQLLGGIVNLCNACGIYWYNHKALRPQALWNTFKLFSSGDVPKDDEFAQLEAAVYRLCQQRKNDHPVFKKLSTSKEKQASSNLETGPESRAKSVNPTRQNSQPTSNKTLTKDSLRRIQSSPPCLPNTEFLPREPLSELALPDPWLVLPNAPNTDFLVPQLTAKDTLSASDKENNLRKFDLPILDPNSMNSANNNEPVLPLKDSSFLNEDEQLESFFRTPPRKSTKKLPQSPSPWRSELFNSETDNLCLTPLKEKAKVDLSLVFSPPEQIDTRKANSPHLPEKPETTPDLVLSSQLEQEDDWNANALTTELVLPSSPPTALPFERFLVN